MTAYSGRARVIPRHPEQHAGDGFPVYGGIDPGELVHVGWGARARTTEWDALFAEGRLKTRAHAVADRAENPSATCSHTTAAALHGLPLYRTRSDRVHLIVPGRHTRRDSRDAVRHHLPLPDEDVEVIDGLRVTTLARTVYDVIRMVSLEAAVACFDAALRLVAWDDDEKAYDAYAAAVFRADVVRRISRSAGARGIRQARFVAEFADGRAQLPGESVSRLWMWQLGMPDPQLQRRVELEAGRFALLDFAWPALGRWAEFDGEVKYTDADLLRGRTAEEVRTDQTLRERAVKRATGWRVDRWGFEQMSTIDAFASHLRALGF